MKGEKQQSSILGTHHVLAVKDLNVSVDYYRNALGFVTVWEAEGWHCLERQKFVVMLGECSDDRSAFETRNHSYFAYVNVENIDPLYDEFKQNNVEILQKPENKPWGQREFAIRTVDGHRIMFGEAI